MAQSLMLPAAMLLIGLIAVLAFARPRHLSRPPAATATRGRLHGRRTGPGVRHGNNPML
jgi:hypothetical protein